MHLLNFGTNTVYTLHSKNASSGHRFFHGIFPFWWIKCQNGYRGKAEQPGLLHPLPEKKTCSSANTWEAGLEHSTTSGWRGRVRPLRGFFRSGCFVTLNGAKRNKGGRSKKRGEEKKGRRKKGAKPPRQSGEATLTNHFSKSAVIASCRLVSGKDTSAGVLLSPTR